MMQAGMTVGQSFQHLYNTKDASILNMFASDAFFGVIKEGCQENCMLTVDALSLMDN